MIRDFRSDVGLEIDQPSDRRFDIFPREVVFLALAQAETENSRVIGSRDSGLTVVHKENSYRRLLQNDFDEFLKDQSHLTISRSIPPGFPTRRRTDLRQRASRWETP